VMSVKARVLAVDSVFEGGRMFVGAVSVAYLLKLGYSPSVVSLLKMVQAIVVLLGEFPSGVISDYFGRKRSLLFSVLAGVLGFSCFMHAGHLSVLVLGEAFLALSLCLWSGSYEAWALEVGEVKNGNIQEFFHTNGSLNQFAVLVCGLLGGFLAGEGGFYIHAYLAALLSLVFLFLFLLWMPDGSSRYGREEMSASASVVNSLLLDARTSISAVGNSKVLLELTALAVAMQFAVQPMLHYWQPLVAGVFGESGMVFGFFFAVFCGGSALVSWIFRKTRVERMIGLVIVWTLGLSLVGVSEQRVSVAISLVLAQVSYFFLRSIFNGHVAAHAPPEHRASVLSFVSLVSRGGMLAALLFTSLLLEFTYEGEEGMRLLYLVVPLIAAGGLLSALLLGECKANLNKSLKTRGPECN